MLLEDARSRVGELSVGFWFIAAVAALFGPLLAVALIAIDHAAG